LDKPYDHYDLIPDLEKRFRCRFRMRRKKYQIDDCIIVIPYWQTEERWTSTKEFVELLRTSNKEDEDSHLHRMDSSSSLPISLTPEERWLSHEVTSFLRADGRLKDAYWTPVQTLRKTKKRKKTKDRRSHE